MDYDDDGGVGVGGGCGRCTTANSSAADADERSVDSASTSGPESSTRSLPLATRPPFFLLSNNLTNLNCNHNGAGSGSDWLPAYELL